MQWLNISVDALQSMEFKRSNPIKRSTWLSLMGYCCQHETSGRIEGCRDWSDREWLQVCGVTKEEVHTDSLLCTFEGEDLLVAFYPIDQESKAIQNRINGGKGGRPRKIAAPQAIDTQGEKPCGLPVGSDSLERKGKEGKGKEGNNTLSDDSPPAEDGVLELIEEEIENGPTIEEEAERVWKAYPRSDKRADAIKKIKIVLRDHSADFLIDKIDAYKLTVDDPRFYAHATTWFNGKRYEEDFVPPQPKHLF